MFTIEGDPFLKYNPYIDSAHSILEKHWHEIVASAVLYHVILLLSPTINTLVFKEHYTSITSKKLKLNFDIHIAALVQSLVSIGLCIPMFGHPLFSSDPVFGSYDFAGFTASVTCGYFIWDLFYCCVYHFDMFGLPYLFHACAALIVFGSTYLPFCQPLIPSFLIFEASTPFVNMYWFFTRLPKGVINDTVFMVNGILLIVSFFLCRIVWGLYAAYRTFSLCFGVTDQLPFGLVPLILVLNFGLNVLNIHWFTKMVTLAYKKFSAAPKKQD
ncbi:hypothetical protein OGAPHI_004979 [Ogataea philodendri]|uniref:TLC domain-containing protein n=1 Tax=Ogataea philodendri TaxID=1378263 RepID=A0A9P8P0H6_9ASCO|nr:uncharacterized protein OGAPHI_004979 [Ogataea philodendri]KAH3663578.1 hypothetical protein OGAPHI_004979 [Ogataea philodendri]